MTKVNTNVWGWLGALWRESPEVSPPGTHEKTDYQSTFSNNSGKIADLFGDWPNFGKGLRVGIPSQLFVYQSKKFSNPLSLTFFERDGSPSLLIELQRKKVKSSFQETLLFSHWFGKRCLYASKMRYNVSPPKYSTVTEKKKSAIETSLIPKRKIRLFCAKTYFVFWKMIFIIYLRHVTNMTIFNAQTKYKPFLPVSSRKYVPPYCLTCTFCLYKKDMRLNDAFLYWIFITYTTFYTSPVK